jgi:hypothetical protein
VRGSGLREGGAPLASWFESRLGLHLINGAA